MTHVVTEPCFGCKYTDCVVVCPVDCFHEGEQMLYINLPADHGKEGAARRVRGMIYHGRLGFQRHGCWFRHDRDAAVGTSSVIA